MEKFIRSFVSVRHVSKTGKIAGIVALLAVGGLVGTGCATLLAKSPTVGQQAAPFTLSALDGTKVTLDSLKQQGPVVLIVLRGYPGYQCPICTAQVGGLIKDQEKFSKAGAQVVLVYPGPGNGLKEHASEFVSGNQLPAHFRLVLDPDYSLVNAYKLRWDQPGETAYPSTFVLDKTGKVLFSKISQSHGDRAENSEILAALGQK